MTEPGPAAEPGPATEPGGARPPLGRRVGHVLVVCTGNVCRSPYIERRMAQLLGDTDLVIESAGTRALAGSSMEEMTASALESVGADAAGFVARQLTRTMVEDADLVLTATQRHRSDVVALVPRAMRRTFSLGELAGLLGTADPSPDGQGKPWAAVVAGAARDQRGQAPVRPADESDIPDPYGRGAAAYALMTHEVERHLLVVASALRPPAD